MTDGTKRIGLVVGTALLCTGLVYQILGGSAQAQYGVGRGRPTGSGYGSGQSTAKAQAGSPATERPFEERFWDWLQTAQYRNWAPMPGQSDDFYPGESPHGAFLKLYVNRPAAGNPKELPHGSILVKENYGPDKKTLMAVTAMYRVKGFDAEHGDWYWVKYETDGKVSRMKDMPIAGRVGMCAECHSGAGGDDFSFAND